MSNAEKNTAISEYNRLHADLIEALKSDDYDAQNDAIHGKIAIRNSLRKLGFAIELDSDNRAASVVAIA